MKIKLNSLDKKKIQSLLDLPVFNPKIDKKVKIIPKQLFYYLIPIFIIFLSIGLFIGTILIKVNIVFVILMGILMLPPFFISFIFFIVRLFIDKNRIKGKIYTLTSGNFLIMNFFLTQKRIKKIVALLDKDGDSIKLNDKRYIVDYETIWKDENGLPNAYYLPNLPNPLKFNFTKYIDEYFKAIKKGAGDIVEIEKEINKLQDWENKPVDVAYSSSNLEKYRNDEFFSDMHEKHTPEFMKVLYIFAGVIVVFIIAIVIIIAIG